MIEGAIRERRNRRIDEVNVVMKQKTRRDSRRVIGIGSGEKKVGRAKKGGRVIYLALFHKWVVPNHNVIEMREPIMFTCFNFVEFLA